jgi:hypothetical protein
VAVADVVCPAEFSFPPLYSTVGGTQ